MSLQSLRHHAVLGPTVAIPLHLLEDGWDSSAWYSATVVTPTQNSVVSVAPRPMCTTYSRAGWLHIPRFLGMRLIGGVPPDDRRVLGEPMGDCVKFNGSLRTSPPQVDATARVMERLHDRGGAMLVLPCGFGKTVCAIWTMTRLRRRTLVLVHTSVLASQWVDRLSGFCSGLRVGRLQQDTVEIDGYDVVVGMLQSVHARKYDRALMSTFGTVVVDEAHHVAAPMFASALQQLRARYILGLTATPDRKDGLGCILPWYLGDVAFRAERETEDVEIRMMEHHGTQVELVDRRGKLRYAEMLTRMALDGTRNDEILEEIVALASEGRAVLVLSERRTQLEMLERAMLDMDGAVSCTTPPPRTSKRKRGQDAAPQPPPPLDAHLVVGRVMGGTSAAMRDRGIEFANVILSTYMYASEGLDIPRLDTLVMASPGVNIEQTLGRILRRHPNKKKPMVLDVHDSFSLFIAMRRKRERYYESQGYVIDHHTGRA